MAKPQSIDFGTTPWGRDWVKRVEPMKITKPNPMLPKARGLVRGGHATVDLSQGEIAVSITAANKQYAVSIAAPRYSSAQKKLVLRYLNEAGVESTASGDLPDALHERLHKKQLEPVPDTTTTLCTCTAKVSPCLHVVAAVYAVGVAIDRTPLKALTFRGVVGPLLLEGSPAEAKVQRWISISDIDPLAYFLGT